MKNFDNVIGDVLKNEGGYVDHPRDPGEATNMGITRKTLAAWRGVTPWYDLPKQAVKDLTVDEAKKIYKAKYWDKVKGDLLPAGLDYAVFDFGLHSGPAVAVKKLQALVGTEADGVVGNKTLSAVANRDIVELLEAYFDVRMKFLRSLSTWGTFGKGWTNRVNKVRKVCLTMVASLTGVANRKDAKDNEGSDNPKVKGTLSLLLKVLLAIASAFLPGILKRFNKVE